jgi:molybdopterin-binding protein
MRACGLQQRTIRTGKIDRGHRAIHNLEYADISSQTTFGRTVKDVELGTVMARVVVKVGDHLVESVITRAGAEELKLKKADTRYTSSSNRPRR